MAGYRQIVDAIDSKADEVRRLQEELKHLNKDLLETIILSNDYHFLQVNWTALRREVREIRRGERELEERIKKY